VATLATGGVAFDLVLRRCGWCAALTSLLALPFFLGTSVSAPTAGADPISDAKERLEQAQLAASEAADRYEGLLQQREQNQAEIATTEVEIAQTEAEITDLQGRMDALAAQQAELKDLVDDRAAALYRNADPSAFLLSFDDVETASRRNQLSESALETDVERARQLNALSQQLEKARADLDARRAQLDQHRADLDARRAEVESSVADLEAQKAELDERVAEANDALEKAETLGALDAIGTPVMGESVLSAEDLASWYGSTDSDANLSDGLTIDGLAQLFIEEGAAENVRGDLAFAQSYLETGGFSFPGGGQVSPDDNNFAGLGACDSCSTGRRFPTARDGVRAQIQHLRNYADETSRAADLSNPPSPYWYGADPATAADNFDTFFAKGWAPLWERMGKGNWATDPAYSGKVLSLYERMGGHATGG
jgi:peptidoglycan hydrolase CwlO-like protein